MKHKHKFLGLLLCCTLLTNTNVYAKGTKEDVKITTNKTDVYLNGTNINANTITVNNSTYLPLRKISEAMGLKVDFNDKTGQIKLTSGEEPKVETSKSTGRIDIKTVNVDMNSVDVFVDGVYIDAPNIVYAGTTYLPLRKISDALGAEVDYDSKSWTIYLSKSDYETNNKGSNDETTKTKKLKPMVTLEDISYPKEPKTVEDFEKAILYMANYDLTTLKITYNDTFENLFENDDTINDNLSEAFNTIGDEYVDLASWYSNVRFSIMASSDGTSTEMQILIEDGEESAKNAIVKQKMFEEQALEINDYLKRNDIITDGMSDKEIAEVLYTYVTISVEYDVNSNYETDFNPDSYTGYGAAKNQIAVCQGYTSLYNYLLKLNGIECYGQAGTMNNGVSHIWTVAMLDNEKCYIDVTHGDPVPDTKGYTNYEYFCISKEELMKTRTWTE